MVFHLDMAFSFEVLTLVAAAALLFWVKSKPVQGTGLVKALAYFGIVVSFLGMLCTVYYGLRYREQGYFNAPPVGMGQHLMRDGSMMSQ